MQKKTSNRNLIYLVVFCFIVSCGSISKYSSNACQLFGERYLWYKHTKKSSETYGAPIHIILAFVNKESGFNRWAKPKRTRLFKVVPYKRPSSSFGYSQAVKGTWEMYKKETKNKLATRARFKDSVDFIGWYTDKTEKLLKISKKDAYRQYLAYHEGWGNYKNYKNNQKVIILAKKVAEQANDYRKQLNKCKKKLNRNKYIIF
mgnify:CR=1 FL=1